jgi:hypothetical protein
MHQNWHFQFACNVLDSCAQNSACLNNVQLFGDCHKLARKLQLLRQPAVVDRGLATPVQLPGRVAQFVSHWKSILKNSVTDP